MGEPSFFGCSDGVRRATDVQVPDKRHREKNDGYGDDQGDNEFPLHLDTSFTPREVRAGLELSRRDLT